MAHIDIKGELTKRMKKKPNWLMVKVARWFLIEDWINVHLDQIGEVSNIEFMKATLDNLQINVEVKGVENLPSADSPTMFVCNHPLGGMDVLSSCKAVEPACGK